MFTRSVFIFFLVSVFTGGAAFAGWVPVDSVGVERRNGKTFVVHKVVPKETLFALSRKYGVPVNEIVDANPNIQSGLSIGQTVFIPRQAPAVAAAPGITQAPASAPVAATVSRTFIVDEKGNKIHQVVEKQTLYSISRMHDVTVSDIKKWNKLTTDAVSVGEKLIVGIGNKSTVNPQYVPEVDDDMEQNKTVSATVATTTTATTRPAPSRPAETPVAAKPEPIAPDKPAPTPVTEDEEESRETGSITKITEAGMAEVIDNRSDNNKYLALHKSAPTGTILQVKNMMNGQSVYVRVIGKLPETGVNDKVIIKISKRAHQKLAALDNKFRVEVSYMP